MTKSKNIIFTGGGSGGHVIPAHTIINQIKNEYNIFYIGGINSIEQRLALQAGINFKPVSNGKLRRYLSFENLTDIFKVLIGIMQSFIYLLRFNRKNTLIFSTGGFVAVPVVIAAALQFKKILIHEQTTRVGLANKVCSYFADKVLVSFEDSKCFFPDDKVIYSGYPVRKEIFIQKKKLEVFDDVKIPNDKKIFFITGGGNGSFLLNEFIKKNIGSLKDFFIIHQVGDKFISEYSKLRNSSYRPVAFLGDEIIDIYKNAHIIMSRSGAGTVSELIALKKRSLFIPLKIAQKNEQYHNAITAKNLLGSVVITEDELESIDLVKLLSSFETSVPENEEIHTNGLSRIISEIDKSFS